MTAPRILYLDAYDSFSNNIVTLLTDQLGASVESIKIDNPRFVLNDDAFLHLLSGFDAVVAGPGPGHPSKPQDIGLISKLWTLSESQVIPVLGICLGFQSLCLAHGASVERLREPRHGLVTPVTHCRSDIFRGTGEVFATQYHSLHVQMGIDDCAEAELWAPKGGHQIILPLAWDLSDDLNGPILMSARHAIKPFWGVQYHPESICTNHSGKQLIQSWWAEVCAWRGLQNELPALPTTSLDGQSRVDSGRTSEDVQARRVLWQTAVLPGHVDTADLLAMLRDDGVGRMPLLLESGTRGQIPVNPETGRFSIIGLHDATSIRTLWSTKTRRLNVTEGQHTLLDRECPISEVFEYLEHFIAERKAIDGPASVPFWGGLIGYSSYEAGLGTIGVEPATVNPEHPDVWFVHVERSIVVDHVDGLIYVQSLADELWIDQTTARIQTLRKHSETEPASSHQSAEIVEQPVEAEYCAKVRDCQSQLRAGESYELCLTDATFLRNPEDDWSLYQRLRKLNPAPFGAYLSLLSADDGGSVLTIASSSPERFLSWSREGQCQFRPIKGTVKKAQGTTREMAEEILRSPKEQAENLMIVDLIRHDLSGVRGVSDVAVPKLMTMEEYATVYQLVSVVTGHATQPLAVLAASLPPGSMTGAPKKRSCEILRRVEGPTHARGIYSGVIGYLDVGGGGDFSVAIRTAFKWGDEGRWRVGAGGAVTVLSEAQAEWEEMVTKRESVLRTFGAAG